MYNRRYVWWENGKKHVAFRSMGDSGIDCSDEETWRSDATCQALHPDMFPSLTPSDIMGHPLSPTAPTETNVNAILSGTLFDPTTWGTSSGTKAPTGLAAAAANVIPGAPSKPGDTDYRPFIVAGAAGLVGYFLFLKKKKPRR